MFHRKLFSFLVIGLLTLLGTEIVRGGRFARVLHVLQFLASPLPIAQRAIGRASSDTTPVDQRNATLVIRTRTNVRALFVTAILSRVLPPV